MHSTEMTDELKIVSKQRNIALADLKELIYLVFKFVREKIKNSDRYKEQYWTIRVMGIGIFYVTKARQNKVKEKLNNDKK